MKTEWHLFTEDYEKAFYDVQEPDGTIIKHCWPNAGFMEDVHGSGKRWKVGAFILIRLSKDHPLD